MTSALVTRWCETAKKQAPLGTMKYLIKAYRMACHYGDSEEEVRSVRCVWGVWEEMRRRMRERMWEMDRLGRGERGRCGTL